MNLDARLTTKQAAALVGHKPATIRKWASRHILRPVARTGRGRPLYRAGDVLDAERQTRHATLRNRNLLANP